MQRVKIGDTYSDWMSLKRGVPQGSVLGPMFFNMFLNDLIFHIKSVKLNTYADDCQLHTSDVDPVSRDNSRVTRRGHAFLAGVFIVLTKKSHYVITMNTTNPKLQAAKHHTSNFTIEPLND